MSVFRNTPRPGGDQNNNESSRYSENILSRPAASDVASEEQSEPDRGPAPSFIERETPRPIAAPTPPEKCTNVIASGSRWSGSLNIEDSVRVEGQLSGEINAKGTVHIADGARVEAKINAGFVVISGSFKGQIHCEERLELLPKSRVEGDLVTKTLNVHEGAVIDGTISMGGTKPAESRGRANATASVEAAKV